MHGADLDISILGGVVAEAASILGGVVAEAATPLRH